MSQFLGTFSGQGALFQITTNGVEFINDKPDTTKLSIATKVSKCIVEDRGFLSENQFEKISDILIKECNDKYGQTDIPHLILDLSDKFKIYQAKGDIVKSRQIKRVQRFSTPHSCLTNPLNSVINIAYFFYLCKSYII